MEREKTIAQFVKQAQDGGYSGVDLDFEHLPINASVTNAYSIFYGLFERVTQSRVAFKRVGNYPTPSDGIVFYDPAVLNETQDVVRVMNYDMYWVGVVCHRWRLVPIAWE